MVVKRRGISKRVGDNRYSLLDESRHPTGAILPGDFPYPTDIFLIELEDPLHHSHGAFSQSRFITEMLRRS